MVLVGVCLGACASHAPNAPQAAKARAVAAGVFGMTLAQLGHTAGVDVEDLPGGTRGCPTACPTTHVRVSPAAAKGPLAFEALMARLQAEGWMLGSTQDTAASCTSGKQAQPCEFQKGMADGVVFVIPGDRGSYEVRTEAGG